MYSCLASTCCNKYNTFEAFLQKLVRTTSHTTTWQHWVLLTGVFKVKNDLHLWNATSCQGCLYENRCLWQLLRLSFLHCLTLFYWFLGKSKPQRNLESHGAIPLLQSKLNPHDQSKWWWWQILPGCTSSFVGPGLWYWYTLFLKDRGERKTFIALNGILKCKAWGMMYAWNLELLWNHPFKGVEQVRKEGVWLQ